MEVFKKTISAVFGGERRYVIPLFQRPYVWTRERQWEPLWDDIVDLAEHEVSSPTQEPAPHFLGAVVIQQRPSWGDQILAHDVIDGQQRLTTFQILLRAFRDHAPSSDEVPVVKALDSWTRNTAMSEPEEEHKLWPTSRDEEHYKFVMTAGSRAEIEARYPPVIKRKILQARPRLVEAYLYFSQAIDDWIGSEGVANVSARTRALRRVFDKRLQLVSIELEKHEDPQAIFETLNARGVPLLASDLLRNYVFQRAGSADAPRLHDKYWSAFEVVDQGTAQETRFWEVEERQGRLSRARLDLFVHHFLAMKRGSEVLSGRLFPTYKDWIEEQRPYTSVEQELQDFTRYATYFRALIQPTDSTELGRFARRLRALDTSTVYPLVLGVLGNSSLTEPDRAAIFTDIESFLVRRLVCGQSTKTYNRLFLQILRDFDQSPDKTALAFRKLLSAGSGENVNWPSDDAFRAAWNTVDAYRELKSMRVDMILRRLNEVMTKAANESITIHGALTVEHVMPQAWKEHWPLPSDIDVEVATSRRDDLVHDFGNLTLLTQALNSGASNGPAVNKLPLIAANSGLRLNAYFQNRTTWTEDDVSTRGEALFEFAKKAWPGPTS